MQEDLEKLSEHGLLVDEGNLIQGPFIPDGRVRIYRESDHSVVAEGRTYEEAVANLPYDILGR